MIDINSVELFVYLEDPVLLYNMKNDYYMNNEDSFTNNDKD